MSYRDASQREARPLSLSVGEACAAQAEQLMSGVPNPGGGDPENPKLAAAQAEQLTFEVPNPKGGDPLESQETLELQC